jgi:O-antigen/teichoic acid export membrane protein
MLSLKTFLKTGHKRSINVKQNIIAMLAIRGVSIVISLILVPLTIDYINPTRYGIWITLSSIVAWFSFFDIGFSFSLRNRFTELKTTNNHEKARAYVSTIYASLGIIFLIVWILFFIVHHFINWTTVLNAPPEMNDELSKLALIVFSFFCLQIILRSMNTILIADQKPAKSSFFDMVGQLLTLFIIFVLTKLPSHSLLYLGSAIGFVPVFVMVISSVWFYNNEYKIYSPSIKYVDFKLNKDILNLGIKFFFIQIAVIVIYQTSNIIIAQVCGPKEVTVYNIAYKYFSVLTMVFMIVLTPIWSAFTEAQAKNDYEWMNNTLRKLKWTWLGLVVGAIILLLSSSLVYHLWIGNKVTVPFNVSAVMFVYVVFFNWSAIFSQIIAGLGKIKLSLFIAIIGSIINIPISVYLGQKWGIIGVVLASTIVCSMGGILGSIQLKLLLRQNARGIWNK